MTREFERKLAFAALAGRKPCWVCGEAPDVLYDIWPDFSVCPPCWRRNQATLAVVAAALDRGLTALWNPRSCARGLTPPTGS